MKRSVTILITNLKQEFALQLRDNKEGLRYSNMWVFPGGGVDEKETPNITATREFQEEFEIKVLPEDFSGVGIYEHDEEEDYLMAYLGKRLPQHTTEGQELRYFPFNEIEGMPLGFHQERLLSLIKSIYHEK